MSQESRTATHAVFVEITLPGKNLDLKESRCAILQWWDEEALVKLLQDRWEKSEVEVRDLLASYHQSKVETSL